MLLEVQLPGSTQLYYACISTGYISVDETYVRYVAMHVDSNTDFHIFFTFRDE